MCPPTGGLNGCTKCDRVRSYAPYRLRDVKHACFYYKWDKGWRRAGPTTTASTTEAASGAQGGAGGSSVPQVPNFTPWFDRASWEEERAYEREACDVRVNELTGDALRWDYALTHSLLRVSRFRSPFVPCLKSLGFSSTGLCEFQGEFTLESLLCYHEPVISTLFSFSCPSWSCVWSGGRVALAKVQAV
jgi:hypothetical protein